MMVASTQNGSLWMLGSSGTKTRATVFAWAGFTVSLARAQRTHRKIFLSSSDGVCLSNGFIT
jgi:hypothetical protein